MTQTVPISYDAILRKDRRTITFMFSETEVVKLVKRYLGGIRRREKVVEIPEWYARKEGLI